MAVDVRYFSLGGEHSAQEWGSIVATLARGRKTGERVVVQTYLDTFDWAICRAGWLLCAEKEETIELVVSADNADLKFPSRLMVDKIPKWSSDLPNGKMQKELAKLADLRSFLPLAQVRSEQILVSVEDKQGNEAVRLVVECNFQQPGPRRKEMELGCRVRVECLAGYEKQFAKILRRLAGLQKTTQREWLDVLMANVGKTPLDYSGKLNIALERDMRSDEALKSILLDQLAQIEANVEGTIKDLDTEFLHDLRVAVRRSRSALSRMKGVLPQTMQDKFADELAWIGQITTPVRDLDVYTMDFPKYRAQLSAEQQENLQPLYEFLIKQHQAARVQLVKDLRSRRFKDFLAKWRVFLEKPVPQRPSAPVALLPVGKVADKRIWKTYRRVVTEGRAIHDETPAEALHDLRKSCKKLRYLLEFFASLYPAGSVGALVKTLKVLQENLGDFQDLDVQAETLHDYSTQMMKAGESRPQVFMSMGVLVEGFMQRKTQVREEFSARFALFSSKVVEKDFRQLVDKQKPKKVKVIAHVSEEVAPVTEEPVAQD